MRIMWRCGLDDVVDEGECEFLMDLDVLLF